MTSRNRTLSSIVLAAAALVSVNAFADGGDQIFNQTVTSTSTKTRAEVKNELLQAQRQGFTSAGTFKNYPDVGFTSTKSRAQVRAEIVGTGPVGSSDIYSYR